MGSSIRVVIAGGSGSLGLAIAGDLTDRGHDVVILTRQTNPRIPHRQVEWDGKNQGLWAAELAKDPQRTAIVNLAGRLVDVRPTKTNIADLRNSRVDATRALVKASETLPTPLASWVQASTTAIWSDAGEQLITENSPIPTGPAALPQMTGVAQAWEAAVNGARTERLAVLRTSLVLQQNSPVMNRFTKATRLGLGGRIGSGQQWISWIHINDWLAIVRSALGLEQTHLPNGVIIASAPNPVRNSELMALLRKALRRPAAPPTPALAVRIGSVFMCSDPLLGLTGRHCTSTVLDETGFTFEFPTLEPALNDLIKAKT